MFLCLNLKSIDREKKEDNNIDAQGFYSKCKNEL